LETQMLIISMKEFN